MDLQEEGLILKNPESEWKPTDRSWVKLKPEYARSYEVSICVCGSIPVARPCSTAIVSGGASCVTLVSADSKDRQPHSARARLLPLV